MAEDIEYGGIPANQVPPPEEITDYSDNRWGGPSRGKGFGNFPNITIRPGEIKDPRTGTVLGHRKSTAYIVNHTAGLSTDDDEKDKKYLWVREISIGWGMEYLSGQSAYAKSFYPRHIRYHDASVTAQTASQAHYDDIVDSVLGYQKASVHGQASLVRFVLPGMAYRRKGGSWQEVASLPTIDNTDENDYLFYPPFWFEGYITSVKAGHRKNIFNPEIVLQFAVAAYKNEGLNGLLTGEGKSNTEIFNSFKESLSKTGTETTYAPASSVSDSGYTSVFDPGYGPGGNLGPR